jgi:hypothetical protein
MKSIDEYKNIRIGQENQLEKKKVLEQQLVEFFYLWVINNKGLRYIEEDVMYICRKKMKRIQMSMDDVDSDIEEMGKEDECEDIIKVQESIDIQEHNLIKLSKIAAILSSPDLIDPHAYHWSVLENEAEELLEYAE